MAVDRAIERAIVLIAGRQNGMISWEQLIELGLTPSAIRHRVAQGRLWHVHHGVYAIADPALLPLSKESAALLSVGDGAVLAGRSAAAVWGLAKPDGLVEVICVGRKVRPREGVRIRRVQTLDRKDISGKSNLTLTAPPRTVIDFGLEASASELEHAIAEGWAQRLLNDKALNDALTRAPRNHPGAKIVRSLLRAQAGGNLTRSTAERLVLKLLRAADLPRPEVNEIVHGYRADLNWPEYKLIVEFDGYPFHSSRFAFERDRRRDQVHMLAGIRVMRMTWRQLEQEPFAVIARIAQALMMLRAA